ncbi:Uncharacterised protein [uncultured archaeon]|nr:Uncharacterised protein [uncultured archaeon]
MNIWNIGEKYSKQGKRQIEITISSQKWYWYFLENFGWKLTYVCDWLGNFRFPRFIREWKGKWGHEDESCTFGEYYGDTIDVIWHLCIETPYLSWVFNHNKSPEIQFTMTPETAERRFNDFSKEEEWLKNL